MDKNQIIKLMKILNKIQMIIVKKLMMKVVKIQVFRCLKNCLNFKQIHLKKRDFQVNFKKRISIHNQILN